MNGIRSFIAIELPEPVKDGLAKLEDILKNTVAFPAKWVATNSIHLTLCFLGEIGPEQIEAVKSVMASTASETAPFELKLTSLGAFPNLERPQIIWAGVQGNLEALQRLHRELEAGLQVMGYRPENRLFKPHLTLARIRDDAGTRARQEIGKVISSVSGLMHREFIVSEINLMKSDLQRSGPVYTRLQVAKFQSKAKI